MLAGANVPELELIEIEKNYHKRTRLTTDILSDGLPVEALEHDPPENEKCCPECGDDRHVIRHRAPYRVAPFFTGQIKEHSSWIILRNKPFFTAWIVL